MEEEGEKDRVNNTMKNPERKFLGFRLFLIKGLEEKFVSAIMLRGDFIGVQNRPIR